MITYMKQITLISLVALLNGCSGHALQDLVDGNSQNKADKVQPVDDTTLPPPSQNRALQSISPSTTAGDDHEEYRYIQQNTNEWLEEEWEPLTENNSSDEKNSNIDANATVPFANDNNASAQDNSLTLQHYVDKAALYLENKEKRDTNTTKPPSHTEKLNALPGIGEKDGR